VFISQAVCAVLVSLVAVNRKPAATDRIATATRPGVWVASASNIHGTCLWDT
jgi:hypothetical protein